MLVEPLPTGVTFARRLADFGDRPALITARATLTYADLARRVIRFADSLGGARRLVLVAAGNDVETVVAHLGALSGGHVVLLTADREEEVGALVAAYDPDVVVRSGRIEERRAGSAHTLHPDLSLLLSTSGTTGSPRLVRLGAAGVQANAEAIAEYLSIRDTDVAVTTMPLHYCYGLSVLHSHLVRGAAVLLSGLSVVDACFWDAVRDHGVTSIAGVPYTFEQLERTGFAELDVPSLRYLTQAGGRMPADRVRRYAELGQRRGFDLFVMYGQTEATARMAYLPPDLVLEHPGAVGVAIPGGALRVDAPDGEVGELVYTGPNVMLGYAASPADLARGREVVELRTGDLARIGEAGLVEIAGRAARFAKVFGLRVDLDRLERVLADDGMAACCTSDDATLFVAVEGDGGPAVPRRAAERAAALTGLPPGAVAVVGVRHLPRLSSGKVDAVAARALTEASRDARPGALGVAATFALVLGRESVTRDDSFVSLGGDSLSYVEASVRLEEVLGQLPAQWHLRTVGELEEARSAASSGAGRRRRWMRTVETGVVLRAAAIVAIVGSHASLFAVPGGAHLLLALVGFNLARFHLTAAPRRQRARGLLLSAARVAVPSSAFLLAVTALTGAYPWPTVFLVNGVLGPRSWAEPAWHLWFIEALVATVIGLAVLVAVPWVDRLDRRWPFWFPISLTVLALTTRYDLVELRGGDEIHRAYVVFWLVGLGWATARATRWHHRAVVSVLALATVPGFFGDAAREAVVVGGLLALVWVPHLRVPAPVARLAGLLATASLWVYLTQWQVYPHLEDQSPVAAVVASLAVGLATWWLVGRAGVLLTAAVRRPGRQPTGPGGGANRAFSPASSTGRAPATTATATRVPTS